MNKRIVADCTSELTIENDDDTFTVSIKMKGVPNEIVERIIEAGDALSFPLITAIMNSVGSLEFMAEKKLH